MSDAERTALLQKKRRFDDLSAEEQTRLRQIHEECRPTAPQELQQVLERYYDWLRTLTPLERAEVLSLPADKRLKRSRS